MNIVGIGHFQLEKLHEWIILELESSNQRIVIEPKDKNGSYGEMICDIDKEALHLERL